MRYQVAKQADKTNNDTKSIRKWGVPAEQAKAEEEKATKRDDYQALND